TRMPSTRPETADLTSTLISGSTTPTSRTLTCRSSAWTLPRRNGDSFSSGLFLVVARATTMPPATRITTAMAITFFLLRMRIPFSLTMSGSDRLRPTLVTVVCFPPSLLTRERGKRLRGEGKFLARRLREGCRRAATDSAAELDEPCRVEVTVESERLQHAAGAHEGETGGIDK